MKNALDIVADILDGWHIPESELEQIRADIARLQTDLLTNSTADDVEKTRLDNLVAEVERVAARVEAVAGEIDPKINTALMPVLADIAGIQQQATTDRGRIQQNETDIQSLKDKDTSDDQRHQFLLSEIARLEALILAGGLTEEAVQALIETNLIPLKADILALQQQDEAQDGQINGLLAEIARLEALIQQKITAAEAQTLIDAVTAPLNTSIGTLDTRVTTLENRPAAGGLSDADVRRIVGEELVAVKSDINDLKRQNLLDDQRIQNLILRVEALERQPTGNGISEAEVRRIVSEEAQRIRADINLLKMELQGEIALKADRSDLVLKADKTEVTTLKTETDAALALKADKTELAALETAVDAKLDLKADKTELDTLENEIDADLALKADKTELDTLENELDADLALKADKTELDTLETAVDGKLDLKADKAELETLETAVDAKLDLKADKTELETLETAVDAKLDLKADKTELEDLETAVDAALDLKADKTELTTLETAVDAKLDLKADKTELAALETAVDGKLDLKADKTELAALETAVDAKLDLKADKTELAALETAVDGKLDLKADKTELTQEIEDLREEWLRESQNGPGARLARLCLQGWGIVGGLDIYSDDKDYIHITPGIGVTPNGTLVVEPIRSAAPPPAKSKKKDADCDDDPHPSGTLVFSHRRLYANAAGYPFFLKPDGKSVYEIWELLEPSNNLPDTARALTPQDESEYDLPFITDKIVLLLPDGPNRRYLLMRREDLLEKMALTTSCKPKNPNTDYLYDEGHSPEDDMLSDDDLWACLHPAVRLPEIPLYRFGYYQDKDCDPADLDITDFPTLTAVHDFYATWRPIVEEAFGYIEKATKLLLHRYHPTLFPMLDPGIFEEKLAELSEKWTRFTRYNDPPKTQDTKIGTKYYAQYFYDWARDLIAAYHELRGELIELMNDLRPYTVEMLAKQYSHLLLGPALQPDSNGLDAPLRDYFHQPPIYNGNAARLETCRLYYRRLFEMMDGFYLEDYAKGSKMPGWCMPDSDEHTVPPDFSRLRITPGKGYIHPLSHQAIPFYYPLNDNTESLQYFWNYHRAKTRSTDRILSYHATDTPPDFPSYSNRREVIRPLYYSLDPHDFYRIEGHIGKSNVRLYGPTSDQDIPAEFPVVEALEFLVRKYNLDFKILPVSIGDLQKQKSGQPPYRIGAGTDLRYVGQSFVLDLLGAEHLAGVPKGGTFIVVMADMVVDGQTQKVAVADFALPYRCCCCAEPTTPCALDLAVSVSKACDGGKRHVSVAVTPSNPFERTNSSCYWMVYHRKKAGKTIKWRDRNLVPAWRR
ncbi:MAG: hypothetical protein IPM98_12255 [Lewinellaceae bacterium]|nr:hypothetical protein [Lewinellaceae bacterium]